MDVRLVNAPIDITFSQIDINKDAFVREYHQLNESDDDPISQWLKLAKAKGESSDSDPLVLNLLVELHKKIDALEMYIKGERVVRLNLEFTSEIESIGFEHFKLSEEILTKGEQYYGRVLMPIYPKREVAIFFEAESPSLVKIIKMHERDEKEWASYLTARERVIIREMREKS